MSWSLDTQGSGDEHHEREIARKLGQVLHEAGETVHHANFTGAHITGDIRHQEVTAEPREMPLPDK